MKVLKLLPVAIILCVTYTYADAQIQLSSFAGKTWRMNEYYMNYVPFENERLDSVRYYFDMDGILEIRQPQAEQTAYLSFSYNSSSNQISVIDENAATRILTVTYADANNLVFTMIATDPNTGETINSEFRMIPASP